LLNPSSGGKAPKPVIAKAGPQKSLCGGRAFLPQEEQVQGFVLYWMQGKPAEWDDSYQTR